MKLLFDANLSPKLVHRLAELFPDSVHVFDTGLARFISDEVIWEYASINGFAIVTADSDFLELARLRVRAAEGDPTRKLQLPDRTSRRSSEAACDFDCGIGTVPAGSPGYSKHGLK